MKPAPLRLVQTDTRNGRQTMSASPLHIQLLGELTSSRYRVGYKHGRRTGFIAGLLCGYALVAIAIKAGVFFAGH